jgi:Protein similar to CwfJ C-terminus 1/Protein similar to CwfJ C-terminus 2
MTDLEKCWFCLQSGDVEKHLIICIGTGIYVALAKGPINNHHVLILPIDHIQSSSQLSDENFQTMKIFKNSLKKFFDSKNMATVFFERNYKSSHCAVNAIAIPKDVEWQLGETLKDKAEEFNLKFETIPKLMAPKDLPENGPYFVIEFPDETLITRDMKGFPINFGRDVVCAEGLLNAEDKIDWKSCLLPKGLEIDLVRMFKDEYKPFNFTLDDDDDDDE